jgi:hypothetical protein
LALFLKIAQLSALARHLGSKRFYKGIWSPDRTLLAMIIGHLLPKRSLTAVLALMRSGAADDLPGNPLCPPRSRLSTALELCVSTSAYAQARARLPLTWLKHCLRSQASDLQANALVDLWRGMAVQVLDGSLVTLRSLNGIPHRFPPHSNQHGTAYWCHIRVLVCMCLQTGVILAVIMGSQADSEQAQTVRLMLFGSAGWPQPVLWMGDANFGVWRVVAAAQQSGQQCLVRLTVSRAKKLYGGKALPKNLDEPRTWTPTRHDGHDRGLKREAVVGRLIIVCLERAGWRPKTLMLFTTVALGKASAVELAELYARRWNIELGLRHVKAQMELDMIEVKCPAMAKRELYTGMMAYNLVRGVMCVSAKLHDVPVWRISFTLALAEINAAVHGGSGWSKEQPWAKRLLRIALGRLPNRRKRRPSEPRAKRHRGETFPPLKGSRQAAREAMRLEGKDAFFKS